MEKRDLQIRYDYYNKQWKLVEFRDGYFVAVLFVCDDINLIKQKLEELS